jgi:hypothetical protein
VAISDQNDEGRDSRREGYVNSSNRFVPVVEIPKSANARSHTGLLSIRAQELLGSLIAAGGTVWAVYVATTVDSANLWRMRIMPPGPIEVCALGILAWLHGKWRRSMKVD